jgi:hypothetical protein
MSIFFSCSPLTGNRLTFLVACTHPIWAFWGLQLWADCQTLSFKPLLGPTSSDEQQQQHEDTRKSSQHIMPSRKSSLQQIPEDQKPLVVGHEASHNRNCSYTQGVMNGKHSCFIILWCSPTLARNVKMAFSSNDWCPEVILLFFLF